MLKLPIERINDLIDSLQGDVIDVIPDLRVVIDYKGQLIRFLSPLVICVTTNPDLSSEKTHLLYLIDIFGFKCINLSYPEHINIEIGHELLFNVDGSVIEWTYKKGDKWAQGFVSVNKFVVDLIDKRGSSESLTAYEQWFFEFMAIRETLLGIDISQYKQTYLAHTMKNKPVGIRDCLEQLNDVRYKFMIQAQEVIGNYSRPSEQIELYDRYPYPKN